MTPRRMATTVARLANALHTGHTQEVAAYSETNVHAALSRLAHNRNIEGIKVAVSGGKVSLHVTTALLFANIRRFSGGRTMQRTCIGSFAITLAWRPDEYPGMSVTVDNKTFTRM